MVREIEAWEGLLEESEVVSCIVLNHEVHDVTIVDAPLKQGPLLVDQSQKTKAMIIHMLEASMKVVLNR